MPSILIRRAGPESIGPAFYLLQRFFAEEGFTTPPDTIRANLLEFLNEPHYAVFLAERDGQAVGLATVSTALSVELGAWLKWMTCMGCRKHAGPESPRPCSTRRGGGVSHKGAFIFKSLSPPQAKRRIS